MLTPEEQIETKVLDHGFVRLVDVMGDDAAVVQAARVAVAGENVKAVQTDEGLIRYLMRHKHTTPFEMVEFKFHCKMPIFVARQWIRHRTANVNEKSARYGELPEEFYVPAPEDVQYQSGNNKQGRGGQVPEPVARAFRSWANGIGGLTFDEYRAWLGRTEWGSYKSGDPMATVHEKFEDKAQYEELQAHGGIARELARIGLPLSTYTEWYWKIDLHNLMHFLGLRLDGHAQKEIRVFAEAMAEMVAPRVPMCWEAFHDFRLAAVTFSKHELQRLAGLLKFARDCAVGSKGNTWDLAAEVAQQCDAFPTKREYGEFQAKLAALGFKIPDPV